MSFIELKYIEVSQPIGKFYIASITWDQLLQIAYADIRKIENEESKSNSFDSYLGIQRRLSPNRIKEISQYVTTVDASFPTSIIVSIRSRSLYHKNEEIEEYLIDDKSIDIDEIIEKQNIQFDEVKNCVEIRKDDTVAKILDGQHRLEGIRAAREKGLIDDSFDFSLNITIFIDLDLDDEAQIFSVINKAQTKVNKSLVYDLYDYARTRSPQKTAHDIVRLLNKDEESPFFRKVKILGTAEDPKLETVAQATFVELILKYITNDPIRDRDLLKRKSFLGSKRNLPFSEQDRERRIFRKYFIEDEDEKIYSVIWRYFCAVKQKWPKAWRENTKGNILNKSTGLVALMRFLRPAAQSISDETEKISVNDFRALFHATNLDDDDFHRDTYLPGTSGQAKLYHDLLRLSGIKK